MKKRAAKKHSKKAIRTKPLVLKASKKLPHRKNLRPGEILEFRSSRGNLVKYPREDRKYFAFIVDKKTKKRLATANYYSRKTKIIVPRMFTRTYRKYISSPSVRPKIPKKPKSIFEFKLKSEKTILNQIHKVARATAGKLRDEAKIEGFCVFRLKLLGPLGTPISRTLNITKQENLYDVESMIAFSVIDTLRAGAYRMSSKELTDRPQATMIRSLIVQVDVLDVSKMDF